MHNIISQRNFGSCAPTQTYRSTLKPTVQVIAVRTVDAISPRHHQYDWPSSAAAAHCCQHYCADGPVRPVLDMTDKRTSKRTYRQNVGHRHLVNPSVCDLNLNPLDSKGNYSAISNNTKLVHWPLMGALLHLVGLQRGGV